jgi:hypothetical protein
MGSSRSTLTPLVMEIWNLKEEALQKGELTDFSFMVGSLEEAEVFIHM